MVFYGNIIASAYRFYNRFKNERPYPAAVLFILFCQMLVIFLCISIVKKIWNFNLLLWIPNQYYIVGFLMLMAIAVFKYYSKEKVAKLVEAFDKKTLWERRIWGIIAWISILAPAILLPILNSKK